VSVPSPAWRSGPGATPWSRSAQAAPGPPCRRGSGGSGRRRQGAPLNVGCSSWPAQGQRRLSRTPSSKPCHRPESQAALRAPEPTCGKPVTAAPRGSSTGGSASTGRGRPTAELLMAQHGRWYQRPVVTRRAPRGRRPAVRRRAGPGREVVIDHHGPSAQKPSPARLRRPRRPAGHKRLPQDGVTGRARSHPGPRDDQRASPRSATSTVPPRPISQRRRASAGNAIWPRSTPELCGAHPPMVHAYKDYYKIACQRDGVARHRRGLVGATGPGAVGRDRSVEPALIARDDCVYLPIRQGHRWNSEGPDPSRSPGEQQATGGSIR
jgi:hypothetical protein